MLNFDLHTFQEYLLIFLSKNLVEIDVKRNAEQVIKLIDTLEDDEDVKSVHSNFEISERLMNELE